VKPTDTVKSVKSLIEIMHLPIPPDMQCLTVEVWQLCECTAASQYSQLIRVKLNYD